MWFGGWFGLEESGVTPTPPQPPFPLPVPVVHGDAEYVGYAAMALDRICEQFRGDPEELEFPSYVGDPPDAIPFVSTEGGSGTEESPYLLASLTVGFIDASTSPSPIVLWVWDFGDGESYETDDDDDAPTHEYAETGVYLVTLTVTNSSGASDSGSIYVSVVGP